MPRFGFKGFASGASVALSSTQGDNTASNSVASWAQEPMGTIDILQSTQFTITAPAPVWLEARNPAGFNVSEPGSGVYDPSFHDITYIWTVRGSPLSNYSRVENMVASWQDANVAYGKKVSFRFPNPGTYDIDLWCVDRFGVTAEATTQVVVIAPSFAASDTIVYAADGVFTGAPAGTQISSMAALETEIQSRSNPTRVSFKPGETVNDVLLDPRSGNIIRIDTWTEGSKAKLKPRKDLGGSYPQLHFRDTCVISQLTIRDIVFADDWDPTTETGDYGNFGIFSLGGSNTRCDYIIYNCDFTGIQAVQATLSSSIDGNRMMFADCVWDGWQSYGIYSYWNEKGYYAILGCTIAQNPQALAGGPKTGMANDHGAVRLERQAHVYMACSDFFNTSGWSGNPPDANACVRINSKAYTNWSAILDRNVIEGGYLKLKIDGENTLAVEKPGNVLIDKNILLGTARTLAFANLHFGGTTVRNTLFYMPDVIMDEGAGNFIGIEPDENADPTNDQPFAIYNCTFYNAQTATRAMSFDSLSAFSDFTFENNVHSAPNETPAINADGPVDEVTVIPGITPRFAQIQWNYDLEEGTFGAPIADNATFSIPYANIDRQTRFGTGSSAPTDQAYWQAAEAAGDTLHMMRVYRNGTRMNLFATRGEFSVSYADPTNIVITNTSGGTWDGGWELRLDRKSYLDTEHPADTSHASPANITNCESLASVGPENTLGLFAYDDLFGTVRAQPVKPGVIEE